MASKEKLAALYADIKEWFADGGIELDRPSMLKAGSIFSGGFLIIAGIIGTTAILTFDLRYLVGSLYAIVFGMMVQVLEIKNKYGESPVRLKVFYEWINMYVKFLTLQRGKGAFYLGVGLLTFFIGPNMGQSSWTGQWGVMNIAALMLAVVGWVHTFKLVAEKGAPGAGAGAAASGVRPANDELDFSSPMDFSSPYPSHQ